MGEPTSKGGVAARLRRRFRRERSKAFVFAGVWVASLVLVWIAASAAIPKPVTPKGRLHATLLVDGPRWAIAYEADTANNTAFALLREASATLGFEIDWVRYGPPYEDVFITSINGARNDGDRNLWWQYCVNEVYATVGALHQEIVSGDIVRWVYTASVADELCH